MRCFQLTSFNVWNLIILNLNNIRLLGTLFCKKVKKISELNINRYQAIILPFYLYSLKKNNFANTQVIMTCIFGY